LAKKKKREVDYGPWAKFVLVMDCD